MCVKQSLCVCEREKEKERERGGRERYLDSDTEITE
jgi:hypothetical protein